MTSHNMPNLMRSTTEDWQGPLFKACTRTHSLSHCHIRTSVLHILHLTAALLTCTTGCQMDSHTDSTVKPPKLSKQKSKSWYAGITHNINAPYMRPGYLIQHHVLETLSQGNTLSGCGDPCSLLWSQRRRKWSWTVTPFAQPSSSQQVTCILHSFTVLPSSLFVVQIIELHLFSLDYVSLYFCVCVKGGWMNTNVFTKKIADARKVIKGKGIAAILFPSCFKFMMLNGKCP